MFGQTIYGAFKSFELYDVTKKKYCFMEFRLTQNVEIINSISLGS